MNAEELRTLMLQFIASICLCDHMGDVSNEVDFVLKKLGLGVEWDDFPDLRKWCGENGITTLYGTSLKEDDEDDGTHPPGESAGEKGEEGKL